MKLGGTRWDETGCSVDAWNTYQTRVKLVLECSVGGQVLNPRFNSRYLLIFLSNKSNILKCLPTPNQEQGEGTVWPRKKWWDIVSYLTVGNKGQVRIGGEEFEFTSLTSMLKLFLS